MNHLRRIDRPDLGQARLLEVFVADRRILGDGHVGDDGIAIQPSRRIDYVFKAVQEPLCELRIPWLAVVIRGCHILNCRQLSDFLKSNELFVLLSLVQVGAKLGVAADDPAHWNAEELPDCPFQSRQTQGSWPNLP